MEILINLLFPVLISYNLATRSTSGVGSTPGNNTNNIDYLLLVSTKDSSNLNEGYSIYLSPICSLTNIFKAEVTLSGRRALNKRRRWNLVISLNALGRSAISAFSSPYHFFHYKLSYSKD